MKSNQEQGIVKILLQDIGVSWNKENMRHSWLVKDLSFETEIQINSYESRKLKTLTVFGMEEEKNLTKMLRNVIVYINSMEIWRVLYRNWMLLGNEENQEIGKLYF